MGIREIIEKNFAGGSTENKEDCKPVAVVIKGNPDRMRDHRTLAESFYVDIGEYLDGLGFAVRFDPGLDMTCPDKTAAVWVAHSRGAGRIRCIPNEHQARFAKLGTPDGAMAHDDRTWHKRIVKLYPSSLPPLSEQPPKSHFVFSALMKKEVDRAVSAYIKTLR